MNRTIVNLIVDAVAFTAMLFLAATGVLMRFVLPPGSGHFKTLWGMDRHEWGDVHFWIAATLLAVLVVHLFLHWRWIVSAIQGRSGKASGVRLALAIVVLLMLVSVAVLPFFGAAQNTNATPPHRMRSAESSNIPIPAPTHEITGSMSLQEVERLTGVSAAVILKELGLPSDVSTDERLGRLRRQHRFEMEAVRKVVQKQLEQQTKQGNTP